MAIVSPINRAVDGLYLVAQEARESRLAELRERARPEQIASDSLIAAELSLLQMLRGPALQTPSSPLQTLQGQSSALQTLQGQSTALQTPRSSAPQPFNSEAGALWNAVGRPVELAYAPPATLLRSYLSVADGMAAPGETQPRIDVRA